MTEKKAQFIDRTGYATPPLELWEPVIIPKEMIDDEVSRLAALPRPDNGRRQSLVVHPDWEKLPRRAATPGTPRLSDESPANSSGSSRIGRNTWRLSRMC